MYAFTWPQIYITFIFFIMLINMNAVTQRHTMHPTAAILWGCLCLIRKGPCHLLPFWKFTQDQFTVFSRRSYCYDNVLWSSSSQVTALGYKSVILTVMSRMQYVTEHKHLRFQNIKWHFLCFVFCLRTMEFIKSLEKWSNIILTPKYLKEPHKIS